MCYTWTMSDTTAVPKRQPIAVRLNDAERAMVEARAEEWGVSLAAAIRRMIREYGRDATGSKR